MPPLANVMLAGMFKPSAKTVNLSARPSPSVSSQILMRSLPLPGAGDAVRVVERLDDPQPPALVPRHRERLDHVGLGDEQLRLEPLGQDHVLLRFVRRQRLGHLVPHRVAAPVRLAARLVERDALGGHVLERLGVGVGADELRALERDAASVRVAQRMPRSSRS